MTIVTMLMVVVVVLVLKLVWVAGKWRDQSRRAHVGDAEEWKTGSGEWSLSIPCHEGETAAADCVRHISVISSRNKASIYYTAPDREAEYCDVHVCLCVCMCLPVCDHIFETTHPVFTEIFVHVTCGHGSVLLWWRSDVLCTSGLMDDVVFAHKPRLLDITAQLKCSAHTALGLAVYRAQ